MSNLKNILLGGAVTSMVMAMAIPSLAQTAQDNAQEDAEKTQENADEGPKNALDNIVVTGTRQERKILEIPANISVISDVELDKRMDFTLEDTLRYEPGISVTRQTSGTDPFSNSGGVQIRGVGGNRTQVIVDGTRTMESISGGSRDVVDASNMKAVEVQRGPASVLWGSDGLGGVIAFITKDPADYLKDDAKFGGNANFSFSSLDDTFKESVAGAYQISPDVSAMLVYTRRDSSEIKLKNARIGADALQDCPRDPRATRCNEFDPQDIASNDVLAKLVWNPSENNQLRLSGTYFDRTTDMQQNSVIGGQFRFGQLIGDITGYDRTQAIKRWRVSVDQEWAPEDMFIDNLKWQVTYSPQTNNRNGDRRRNLSNGDQEQFLDNQEYGEEFTELDVQFTSSFDTGGTTHQLTYGFDGDQTKTDYNRIDITRNLTQGTETVARAGGFNFADAKTTRADIYIQDEISLMNDRLKLVPGARLATYKIDPTTDADFQLVPGAEPRLIKETDLQLKAGMIFDFNDTISMYAQYSQGFKMPTAQQLYQSLDSLPFFALVPNPNLLPESVQNYEVGLRGNFGTSGFFSANIFKADYVDFIENFVGVNAEDFGLPPGSFVLTYDNVDALNIFGLEASAGMQLSEMFSARMSASWQDGTIVDGTTRRLFLGSLPFKGIVGVNYNNDDLGLDIDLTATIQDGNPEVIDPDEDFSPPGYAVFDIVASWEVTPNLRIQANVFNLTNKRYFGPDTRGFPINGTDATKSTNPIELRTAPGRNFKIGLAWTY